MLQKGIAEIFDMRKFIIVAIVMMIIWGSIFILFWKKGSALQEHPCSLCAEQMGKDVLCVTEDYYPITMTFYENGTIDNNAAEIITGVLKKEDKSKNYTTINSSMFNFSE